MTGKLWIVVVGGYPPGAHVEVHDTRFVIAETLEDCVPTLKAEWWGGEDRFHIDAWGVLEWADGHDVVIAEEKPEGAAEADLWFVNLGGYREEVFAELHRDVFVAATSGPEAKRKALKLAQDWDSPHRDDQMSVESAVQVADAAKGRIWLVPNAEEKPFRFEARYLKMPR